MKYKFKKGFTLAEMLLSIIIIGVISAIALPSLKDTADKSSNIALVKKAYSTASNAFAQLQADMGVPIYWTVKNSGNATIEGKRVFDDGEDARIAWVLKKVILSTENEIPDDYKIKKLSGTEFGTSVEVDDTKIDIGSSAAFQSTDGMFWFPSKTYSGCQYKQSQAISFNWMDSIWGSPAFASEFKTIYLCGMLVVDTNGAKKPNRMGIDVFVFDIMVDGIMPHIGSTDDCVDLETSAGTSCANKVIRGGEKALDFIYE